MAESSVQPNLVLLRQTKCLVYYYKNYTAENLCFSELLTDHHLTRQHMMVEIKRKKALTAAHENDALMRKNAANYFKLKAAKLSQSNDPPSIPTASTEPTTPTDLITTQLTPIVEQGVSKESANLQESVDLQNFELQVVQEVSQSLKPTIIRIIQVTVAGMHKIFNIYIYTYGFTK